MHGHTISITIIQSHLFLSLSHSLISLSRQHCWGECCLVRDHSFLRIQPRTSIIVLWSGNCMNDLGPGFIPPNVSLTFFHLQPIPVFCSHFHSTVQFKETQHQCRDGRIHLQHSSVLSFKLCIYMQAGITKLMLCLFFFVDNDI